MNSSSSRLVAILLMSIAVFAMSTSVIFIKLSDLAIPALTTGRLFLSVLMLSPLMLWQRSKAQVSEAGLAKGWWWLGLLPGLFFAAHLVTWALGARMTSSANATLAVNTAPLVMPFLLYWIAREKVTKVELLGTGVAFTGLVVLTAADAQLDPQHFKGDLVCMGSMLLLAVYLALGRRILPRLPSPWLYSVPLYFYAGLTSLMFALDGELWAPLFGEGGGKEWLWLFGLAVIPTILGHGFAMAALRVLRGQVVAVMSLGQFLTAGLMAWWVFGEKPHGLFYVAAVLVVAGCAIVIFGKDKDGKAKR